MSNAKILVVEDEWLVAQGIRESLDDLGYEVVGLAAAGEEALRLAEQVQPDLVLMDILLQGDMDGIEAAEQLRQRFGTPVVFLTAYADAQTLARAKIIEPYGYLLKPFEVRELHSNIEIALYKSRAEKRLQHLNQILHAIRNVNQLIVTAQDRRLLITRACQLLAEGRGYVVAWIALLDEEGRVTAAAAAGETVSAGRMLALLEAGELPPCGLKAQKRPDGLLILDNPALQCPRCDCCQREGDRGTLVTRLAHDQVPYGLLGVQLPAALGRDEEELSLFRELAADLSLALCKMNLEDREQQALQALKDSEVRYRTLVEGLPVGIFQRTVGEDNRLVTINPALKAMFGCTPQEACLDYGSGVTYADPDQRQRFNEQLETAGRVAGMELSLLKKDGAVFPARVWAQLQGFGEAARVEGVVLDITAEKQAQAALEESLSLYRATLDSTADGILVVNLEGRIVSFNHKFQEIWGLPAEVVEALDDDLALAHVLEQLADPPGFLERVRELYAQPDLENIDVINFKDGRVFERYSIPQYLENQVVGRVWSFRDVTGRVRAEAALRQNEATLRGLFRAAPIGMGLTRDRTFVMVNEHMTRMTGYTTEELRGHSVRVLYADDAEFHRVGRVKYPQMEEQGIGTLETTWRHQDGHFLDVLLSSSPVDLGDGQAGVVFTALDITQRKQAEAALLQAKETWERTFNTIPDLIAILDTEHRIIRANFPMADALKLSPETLLGLKCHQLVHGQDFPPENCPHLQALADGTMHTAEIHEDSLGGDFLVTCSPLHDPQRNIIGSVHVARDITKRKRIEEELQQYRHDLEQLVSERTAALIEVNAELSREIAEHQQTEQALRDSEARFRAIFEEAPIGITLRNPQGEIVAINPALEKLLGYAPEEYTLRNKYFLQLDDSPPIRELYRDLAEGRRDYFIVENRALHKGGWPVWGRIHASKIRGKDDQEWFTISLIEDITREKETQAELGAYQERLRALAAELTMTEERERRRLATDLHDNIGQVLALLQIKLGSLRQELPSSRMAAELDEARRLLTEIISSTRSLTLEMGLPVLHELGFASGVEWLGDKFQEQYGLQVEVDCAPLPPAYDSAQESFLFRAVRELLTNVAKHAQARRVQVTAKTEDQRFLLQVADDGIGFEVSNLTEVAGFGLFSIAERVSNQGGKMEVTSAPAQGTMVTITFDLEADF